MTSKEHPAATITTPNSTPGQSGRFGSERVAAFRRNQWPLSSECAGGRRTGLLMPGSGPLTTVEGSPWHPQRSARRRHADLRCERLDGHQQSFPCSRLNPSSPATFPWTSRIVWAVCSSFSSRATFASSSCTFALRGLRSASFRPRLLGVRP